jgi:hypothetical protein
MDLGHFILAMIALVTTGLWLWPHTPFYDKGSQVFTCTSPKAWYAMVTLCRDRGLHPQYRIESPGIIRALFPNGVILNYAEPELLEKLGNPSDGLALRVKNPLEEAKEAARFLEGSGFKSKVIEHSEPGMDGKIVFVKTPALKSAALIFRHHKLKLGKGRPPKWHWGQPPIMK